MMANFETGVLVRVKLPKQQEIMSRVYPEDGCCFHTILWSKRLVAARSMLLSLCRTPRTTTLAAWYC